MIINGTGVHLQFLKNFRQIILRESRNGLSFVIICGGGNTARVYQAAGRQLKFSDTALDMIGIRVTKVNAEFVQAFLGDIRSVTVCGGERVGQSTDAVAVTHAVACKAQKVINISSTAYVYDADPKKNKSAQKFDALSWKQYRAIVGSRWVPGMHAPFDPTAARLAQKNKLSVAFMGGDDLGALTKILHGKKWHGSIIQ